MAGEVDERSQIADRYLSLLPYPPYRVQEEALLAWFTAAEGVLVCAPTGTGKTLIAEAALYEALATGRTAYYTTPLIALTEQKFQEMQARAVRWGFRAEDVGLVTGNRRVNPAAKVLVVVAEILLNRLLHPAAFDFSQVSAVVVDEFHSFSDPDRGIVWELTLGLLPPTARLLLLSATVGNAEEFLAWLARCHGRRLELVQETERRVPLEYRWIADRFLGEQLEAMAAGDESARTTPALVFCFNREECWTVAEQLKGLDLAPAGQREELKRAIEPYDWSQGASPKLRQLLVRGVGVHHAGLLPKYRRLVEDLYLRKLLSVCVCTETLAAGINLPARSVVFTTLLKGPRGKKKLIDASTARQIAGRAGRPQFDARGYVYAMAHEDDVRILRWQAKYNSIPEHTKDPGLLKAKKDLWRKRPTRRETEQYWNEGQFQKLMAAPPGKLYSKGPLPWRLLAYLLTTSPEVDRVRSFVRRRLLDPPRIAAGLKHLDLMLLVLWKGGFVELEPTPPAAESSGESTPAKEEAPPPRRGLLAGLTREAETHAVEEVPRPVYQAEYARPKPELGRLLVFRSVHPIYATFLLEYLGLANRAERIAALESLLEIPRPLLRQVRPPPPEEAPPGPLERDRLDPELLKRGLLRPVVAAQDDEEEDAGQDEEREQPIPLADKLRMLFDATWPGMEDVRTQPVWAAGELLRFGGDFHRFVRAHDLVKQEGIVFRHLLRMILLCGEFAAVCPAETTLEEWRADLKDVARRLTESCRSVDPESTDKAMSQAKAADLVEGESFAEGEEAASPAGEDWKESWDRQWDQMMIELQAETKVAGPGGD